MFRTSYLAKSAVAFLVFVTTALTGYVNCTEDLGSLLHKHGIELGEPINGSAEHDSLHCPDDLDAYAVGKRIIETQKFSVGQAPENFAEFNTHHWFGRLDLAPSALFPYRLVPLYQFNAVYRI